MTYASVAKHSYTALFESTGNSLPGGTRPYQELRNVNDSKAELEPLSNIFSITSICNLTSVGLLLMFFLFFLLAILFAFSFFPLLLPE